MHLLAFDWIKETTFFMVHLIIRLKCSREYITQLLGFLLRPENMIILTPILQNIHWLPVRPDHLQNCYHHLLLPEWSCTSLLLTAVSSILTISFCKIVRLSSLNI